MKALRWVLLAVVAVEAAVLASRHLAGSRARGEPDAKPEHEVAAVRLSAIPGPIADAAGVLGGFRNTLEWQIRSWREDFGIEIQVVSLHNTRRKIEPLADQIFQQRRIGEGAPTGGLLVLLNSARGEARIEVSYALEHVFPDLIVGRVARDQLAPYAAYRIAGMAVIDVLHFLKDYAYLQVIRGTFELPAAYRERPEYAEKARYLSGGAGARATLDAALDLDRDFKAPVPADRRARYAPSADPVQSAERYLQTLRDRVGDPTLELYTPGSRCLLAGYPYAPFEQLERLTRAEASLPLRAAVEGNHAVLDSERPAHGFVPILLERRDGLWQVDLVETWKNLFFGSSGDYHQRNSGHPYGFGLARFGAARDYGVSPWLLAHGDPTAARARLAASTRALDQYLLGELLFRNCWLAVDALAHYERAIALSPHNLRFHETLGDRAAYIGFHDIAVSAYAELGSLRLLALASEQRAAGDLEAAIATTRRALERDPYWSEALELQHSLLVEREDARAARGVAEQLDEIRSDPRRPDAPVTLGFDPPYPILHSDGPVRVGDADVYDYSLFGLTLTNPSAREVEIVSVAMTSDGTAGRSGRGVDMKDSWKYPRGSRRLAPGELVRFDKSWGYSYPIDQDQLRYVFDVCWKDDRDRQCRAYWVDLLSARLAVAGLSDPARAATAVSHAALERGRRQSPEIAARLERLALLRAREFGDLTREVEAVQAAFESDPSRESIAAQLWDTFATSDPAMGPALEAWASAVDSYAPRAALGVYHRRSGWEARGERWTSNTTSEQFHAMREHFAASRANLLRALELHPRLIVALQSLINQGKAAVAEDGELRRLVDRAASICPSCIGPPSTYLDSISPRWGGSQEQMERFLAELAPRIREHPRLAVLRGTVAAERAKSAREDHEAALRLYGEALRHGDYWTFRSDRGQVLYRLGRYQEALADLEFWIAHGPRTAEALMWKAYALTKLNRREEAAHAIAIARMLDPGDAEIARLARSYGVADGA